VLAVVEEAHKAVLVVLQQMVVVLALLALDRLELLILAVVVAVDIQSPPAQAALA
jgi:hypothetical protein